MRRKKKRDREKEEYEYSFKRQQQIAKDKYEDDKAKLEKEILLTKERMDGELTGREKIIAAKKEELNDLRKRVALFPREMDAAVAPVGREHTGKMEPGKLKKAFG